LHLLRGRSVEENLEMLRKMKAGEYEEGTHVLRAKIDMAASNINMRDPAMYRIRKAAHVITGDKWKIYPMYDFAHCISDAIEGITHSLCTLEFEDHRPLYDWCVPQPPCPYSRLAVHHPPSPALHICSYTYSTACPAYIL
jgi:glutaminyl-tRNA synthetase